jgi:hypothetical protein
VPRSPEPACQVPARKHAQDEHSEAQTAPARHATIADRSTRTTALILTRAGFPQPTPARNHAHASPDPPRHPRGKSTTEEGVVGHRAAYGRLPALLQPTKGIPRLPETIQTSGSCQEERRQQVLLAATVASSSSGDAARVDPESPLATLRGLIRVDPAVGGESAPVKATTQFIQYDRTEKQGQSPPRRL